MGLDVDGLEAMILREWYIRYLKGVGLGELMCFVEMSESRML